MSKNISVIECRQEQLAEVNMLSHLIWPEAYGKILSAEQITYMLGLIYGLDALKQQFNDGQRFFLLQKDEKFVGYFSVQHHLKYGEHTKLHKIYLLQTEQGSGLGKFMLAQAKQLAIDATDKYLYLNVNKYNAALEFYKSACMQIVAEEDIDIGCGYFMNDYVLEMEL
jgi:diamine N-acetyltransferase